MPPFVAPIDFYENKFLVCVGYGVLQAQTHYILKVLEKLMYLTFNRANTTINVNLHLNWTIPTY